jgi:hypothetical protein
LAKSPPHPRAVGPKEHASYLHIQTQIQSLKEKVSKKHDQLMEILKSEEKISREIQDKS